MGYALFGCGGVLGQILSARAPVLLGHGLEALAHLGETHGSSGAVTFGDGSVTNAVGRHTVGSTASLTVVAGAGQVAGHVNNTGAEATERVATPALVALLDTGDGPASTRARFSATINADGGVGELLVFESSALIVTPAAAVSHVATVDPLLGNRVQVRTSSINGTSVGVRVVTVLSTRVAVVESDIVVAVEVVVEDTGLASRRVEHAAVVVGGVDQVDSVTVVALRVGARWAEPVDEVEEALVTVLTGGVGTAGRAVVTHILQGAAPRDHVGLEVLENSITSLGDELGAVGHGVVLEVVEALTVVIIGGAVGNVHRAVLVQPGVAARVSDPVHETRLGVQLVTNSSVARQHLAAHGVANEHDALHVGVDRRVVEVLDDLIQNVEGGDISLGDARVLVVATSRPLGSAPDERAAVGTTACLLVRVPGVREVLVGAAGEVRCDDRDGITVDVGVVGCRCVERVQSLCIVNIVILVHTLALAHIHRSGSPRGRGEDRE
jgi:hypothetical protein